MVAQPLALSLAPGRGMVEMAAEDDLLPGRRPGSGDGRGDHVVVTGVLPGAHHGVQADRLAGGQPALEGARRS